MNTRRDFLKTTAAAGATLVATELDCSEAHSADLPRELIVDTHQHLWDLGRLKLPWLNDAPQILRNTYHLREYEQATQGLTIRSVYMEVDVDTSQLAEESQQVIEICRNTKHSMRGAVIGGRPESVDFPNYVALVNQQPYVKGVRRVLHAPETPAGYCLQDQFVRNIQYLGTLNLSFDLCMRPAELSDGLRLATLCPDTRFIVDHCGNGDPRVFSKKPADNEPPGHNADQWKKDMEAFAQRSNVICKISGVIARLWPGGGAAELAPIVNHCLDTFGPDRVVFGGDWPVCLLGGSLLAWIGMLGEIISSRPIAERRKLWAENAIRDYQLERSID